MQTRDHVVIDTAKAKERTVLQQQNGVITSSVFTVSTVQRIGLHVRLLYDMITSERLLAKQPGEMSYDTCQQ